MFIGWNLYTLTDKNDCRGDYCSFRGIEGILLLPEDEHGNVIDGLHWLIDENLIRNELHYIERGEQLARRKVIYEGLYPETKREATLKQNRSADSAEREVSSFIQDTAAKTGKSSRVIHEEVQIANNLTDTAKQAVISADIPKTDALKLARLEPTAQDAIADLTLTFVQGYIFYTLTVCVAVRSAHALL